MSELKLWQPNYPDTFLKETVSAAEISTHAVQLNKRDKSQIVSAFESGFFEMGLNYLWIKSIAALKKELSTVGVGLLGEMLGKTDIGDDDSVFDFMTDIEAIQLAKELGVINETDSIRLRHTHEIITHFSQLDEDEAANEAVDVNEALASLKVCVKAILGRPKVEVAAKFVEYRKSLEEETLNENDTRIESLAKSPYFFHRLTINVLMSAAKQKTGANLEHVLANIVVIIPNIWSNLREKEKWQVGRAYAENFSNGKAASVKALKIALMRVKGFDFVPERFRSDTFIKAAKEIINAHEGMNNFHNELTPVINLGKLGSTIPSPALSDCFTALLCVVMGNQYGISWSASPEAKKLLIKMTHERWEYYLDQVLPGDIKIIQKLTDDNPKSKWISLIQEVEPNILNLKNNQIKNLVNASFKNETTKINKIARKLYEDYYGKKA